MSDDHARILLWGIAGSGKTTTLRTMHDKLRSDLRGEMHRQPTRLDPTVHYETLPISLGEISGVETQLEVIAVPGDADQAMTRKQLLDEIDGLILVLDCSPEAIEDNFAAIKELKESLAAYGQRLDAFPIVLQYNKRDIADPFAIEDLHRRIGLEQSAVFETIATTGHGVLATLTTISKHVVRARRGASQSNLLETASTPAPASESTATSPQAAADSTDPFEALGTLDATPIQAGTPDAIDLLEGAILAEGEDLELAATPSDENKPAPLLGEALRVVSCGEASVSVEGELRLPLVLGDSAGSSQSFVLSLRLDSVPNLTLQSENND